MPDASAEYEITTGTSDRVHLILITGDFRELSTSTSLHSVQITRNESSNILPLSQSCISAKNNAASLFCYEDHLTPGKALAIWHLLRTLKPSENTTGLEPDYQSLQARNHLAKEVSHFNQQVKQLLNNTANPTDDIFISTDYFLDDNASHASNNSHHHSGWAKTLVATLGYSSIALTGGPGIVNLIVMVVSVYKEADQVTKICLVWPIFDFIANADNIAYFVADHFLLDTSLGINDLASQVAAATLDILNIAAILILMRLQAWRVHHRQRYQAIN